MLLHSKILGNSENHILILHGFLGSGDNWMSVAKKLSQQDFFIKKKDLEKILKIIIYSE